MSVVVRIEMPKDCKSCPLCRFISASPVCCAIKTYSFDTVSQYYYADKKQSYCPIIETHEPDWFFADVERKEQSDGKN